MNNTEILKQDSDLDTSERSLREKSDTPKYRILGDTYLVQLDEFLPDEGLINLKYNKYTSDSGREAAELDTNAYLPKGTILQIGSQASNPDNLVIGDRIYINPSALTPHYQFFPSRDSAVISFTGMIKIPMPHIEALIID